MKDRILKYLQNFGYITTWDAFQDLGCTRLSEYIRQIRQDHIVISEQVKATNRYGEKVTYYKYKLIEDEK